MQFGGIEAGGTKFVCAVGSSPEDLADIERFPTTTPEETIGRAIDYFHAQQEKRGALDGLGIATFGPAGVRRDRESYGKITTTPKPGWQNVDLLGAVLEALPMPVSAF